MLTEELDAEARTQQMEAEMASLRGEVMELKELLQSALEHYDELAETTIELAKQFRK